MGSKHKGSDSQKHDKAAPKQLAAGRRRRQSRSPVREFEMPEKKKTKKDEKRRKKSEFESVTSFPTKTEVPHEAEIKLEPEPKEPESKEPEPKEPEPKEHESDELFKLIWDPEKSYVGEAKLPKEREIPRPPRRQRYQAPPGQPILSRQEIPSEWKWDEWDRDLDPNDLEAQIQRCKERIEDGILPFIFKDRLSELESSKAAKDDLMAKHPGKSFEVAQSLDNLLFIKKSLEKKDTYKQLSNVRALIKAYKSGKLDWYPGLVTYWSHGKQLCQPRPFSWKEFYLVNRKHDGWESFWVEGLNGPGPSKQLVKIRTFVANVPPQRNSFLRCVEFHLRIPGRIGSQIAFDFIDDTGADMANISRGNLTALTDAATGAMRSRFAQIWNVLRPHLPPIVGIVTLVCAGGMRLVENVIMLEANMTDDKDEFMLPHWSPLQVAVTDDDPPDTQKPPKYRLSGPWPRNQLFMATLPDGTSDTFYFDYKSAFRDIETDHIEDPINRDPLPELHLNPPPADPYAY